MAALYAFQNQDKVKKLILLAPALNLPEFSPCLSKKIALPVDIFHGKKDDVVPPSPIRSIANKVFENHTFLLLDDDHRLSDTFTSIDWQEVLGNPSEL